MHFRHAVPLGRRPMTVLGTLSEGVVVTLLGLVFGSFATMLTHRMPRGESFREQRSRCPACATALTARDLVPVLSWILSHGRCRHCGAAIGVRYVAIEVTTAVAFLAAWLTYGFVPAFPMLAALGLIMIMMAVIDLEHGYLPDPLQIAAAVLAPGWWMALGDPIGAGALGLAAALILGSAGMALRWLYRRIRGREGLGLGDVKLMAVAGLWLGLPLVPAFLVLGGLAGVVLALIWRGTGRGRVFPFGPALALSCYLCLLVPIVI